MDRVKAFWLKHKQGIKDWVWWAAEQFAVLFLPKPSVKIEGQEELQPCSTCWWYRGVLFGFIFGVCLTLLLK